MSRKVKVVGFTLGDPMSPSSRSGVNYQIFSRLRKKCDLIGVYDLDLRAVQKCYSAMRNISFDRRTWGNLIHQNPWAFSIRTNMADKILRKLDGKYDIIYQDGAMFMPGLKCKYPFVSYHDCNAILSANGGMYAHGAHYKGDDLKRTIEQERLVYESASIIFSMSEWLKTSLIKDFEIPGQKIITIYAGTNIQPVNFEKGYDGRTILFVGKNFERKGGPTLLKAFKIVKKKLPDARLVIIGPELNIKEDGVLSLGLISNSEILSKYYREASLFVMPSRFEPFGIAFAEAFAFKLPCIGTDLCAMPEIIEDGRGGYVIPPDEPNVLAQRIIDILTNQKTSEEMGQFGFRKVNEQFNWDIVIEKMLNNISRLVE